ncbi:MAG: hypothetical protein U5P10_05835 [Spirochaetia bacterium]|nr:hypothetical protein [Spirochaetia bacterium]
MKKILIISKSNLDIDPRVYKQILFLKEAGYYITTCGLKPSNIEDQFIKLEKRKSFSIWKKFSIENVIKKIVEKIRLTIEKIYLYTKQYEKHYWNQDYVRKTLSSIRDKVDNVDLIIANDIPALPLSVKLKKWFNCNLYIDAHEYEPLHFNTKHFIKYYEGYWTYFCGKYLPHAEHMTTVCDGIANKYSEEFRVKCDVLMNTPFYADLQPNKTKNNTIKLVHHGAASRRRVLENMIYLMDQLDKRFELHFFLINMHTSYGKELKKIANENERIFFHNPVDMKTLSGTLNQFDIGLYLLTPDSFNQEMALPNKIFEFIQGRLGIAIWPSPEMKKIIDKYENGVYSEDFNIEKMSFVLNRMSKDKIDYMKKNSHLAAKELNAERTKAYLVNTVNNLTKKE